MRLASHVKQAFVGHSSPPRRWWALSRPPLSFSSFAFASTTVLLHLLLRSAAGSWASPSSTTTSASSSSLPSSDSESSDRSESQSQLKSGQMRGFRREEVGKRGGLSEFWVELQPLPVWLRRGWSPCRWQGARGGRQRNPHLRHTKLPSVASALRISDFARAKIDLNESSELGE